MATGLGFSGTGLGWPEVAVGFVEGGRLGVSEATEVLAALGAVADGKGLAGGLGFVDGEAELGAFWAETAN